AAHETQLPPPSHTRLLPQPVPAALLVSSAQVCAPVAHDVVPFLQMLGLLLHGAPGGHATQLPVPLQTRLLPQPVPGGLLVPSTQVWDPVAHELDPFLQTLGFPVQEAPAVQATQTPAPLHTMSVPQPRPADLLVSSTQACAPVAHDVVPFLQVFGL